MNDDQMTGAPNPAGGTGWMIASARRRAMRQANHPPTIKHGLVKAPHIQHPRDNTGPQFGLGGGFKAGGF